MCPVGVECACMATRSGRCCAHHGLYHPAGSRLCCVVRLCTCTPLRMRAGRLAGLRVARSQRVCVVCGLPSAHGTGVSCSRQGICCSSCWVCGAAGCVCTGRKGRWAVPFVNILASPASCSLFQPNLLLLLVFSIESMCAGVGWGGLLPLDRLLGRGHRSGAQLCWPQDAAPAISSDSAAVAPGSCTHIPECLLAPDGSLFSLPSLVSAARAGWHACVACARLLLLRACCVWDAETGSM